MFKCKKIEQEQEQNSLLGTTDVWWKPIFTTIPEVCFAANSANVAYTSYNNCIRGYEIKGDKKLSLTDLWKIE